MEGMHDDRANAAKATAARLSTRLTAGVLTALLCLGAFLTAPAVTLASGQGAVFVGGVGVSVAAAAEVDATLAAPAVSLASAAPRSVAALAADADLTVNGTITIDAAWNRADDKPLALAGDTYSIARVATAALAPAEDGGIPTVTAFHTVDAFANLGTDWTGLSASQLNQRAKDMAAYAGKHSLYDESGATGAAGTVTFRGLDAGVYLVTRTTVAKANARYTCDPFLVSVPGGLDDEEPTLAVTAEPKFADTGEPGTPGEPGGNPGTPGSSATVTTPGTSLTTPGWMAETGANVALVVMLAMIALAIGVGAYAWHRRMRGRAGH